MIAFEPQAYSEQSVSGTTDPPQPPLPVRSLVASTAGSASHQWTIDKHLGMLYTVAADSNIVLGTLRNVMEARFRTPSSPALFPESHQGELAYMILRTRTHR